MAEYSYQLKFVVSAEEDLEEIRTIIDETGADRSRVILMAEGTTVEAIGGRPAYQVAQAAELRPEWFQDCRVVGLTAGTSTPDRVIDEVRAWLAQ